MRIKDSLSNGFTSVFEYDGDAWIGFVEELPGANSQGVTLEVVRENIKEAIALILETNHALKLAS
jgi:predicted RNase H-like HicB family nuclease